MIGFVADGLGADESDQPTNLAGFTSETVLPVTKPATLKRLVLACTDLLTAGSITAKVLVDTVEQETLEVTAKNQLTQKAIELAVVAGQDLRVDYDTASLAPTGGSLLVLLE